MAVESPRGWRDRTGRQRDSEPAAPFPEYERRRTVCSLPGHGDRLLTRARCLRRNGRPLPGGFDARQVVVIQAQLVGAEKVVHVFGPARAHDGGGDPALLQHPGDGHLGDGERFRAGAGQLGGDLGQRIGDRQIAGQFRFLEWVLSRASRQPVDCAPVPASSFRRAIHSAWGHRRCTPMPCLAAYGKISASMPRFNIE